MKLHGVVLGGGCDRYVKALSWQFHVLQSTSLQPGSGFSS